MNRLLSFFYMLIGQREKAPLLLSFSEHSSSEALSIEIGTLVNGISVDKGYLVIDKQGLFWSGPGLNSFAQSEMIESFEIRLDEGEYKIFLHMCTLSEIGRFTKKFDAERFRNDLSKLGYQIIGADGQ